jgi:hypothetical protein
VGTLSFTSITDSNANVNLDAVNAGGEPDDWAVWTSTSSPPTPTDWKLGGGQTISVALYQGNGSWTTTTGGTNTRNVTWTNGTNSASGGGISSAFNSNSTLNYGITLTFPADTNVRTCWIYADCYNVGTATVSASLSDSSASAISDTTDFAGVVANYNPYVIILSYSANSANQTLSVNLFKQTSELIPLHGAAVAKVSAPAPTSIAWFT